MAALGALLAPHTIFRNFTQREAFMNNHTASLAAMKRQNNVNLSCRSTPSGSDWMLISVSSASTLAALAPKLKHVLCIFNFSRARVSCTALNKLCRYKHRHCFWRQTPSPQWIKHSTMEEVTFCPNLQYQEKRYRRWTLGN